MEKNVVVDSEDKHAKLLAQRTSAMLKQCELEKFGGIRTLMEQRELFATTIGCVDTADKTTLMEWLDKRSRMEKRG